MLVSTIIANGRLLADVPNTNFYSDAEALFAAQTSWQDIYAMLCEGGDDYFTTSLYVTSSSFYADASRSDVFIYAPSDLYRLRLLQYQGMGGGNYFPASKMNIENFGNLQNTPAYRIVGQYGINASNSVYSVNTTLSSDLVSWNTVTINSGITVNIASNINWSINIGSFTNPSAIMIYDPSHYDNWCIWYYPSPITLDLSTDLTYPLSMIPQIISYQVAIEIRRKQNIDFASKEERRNELIATMKKQMTRDEAKAETIKNTFGNGFAPYI